jgi:eukaryotic-like serine/threonine-protein kinase
LTGKPPWSGSSFAILAKILMEEPVAIRTLCPHIPESVTSVFERAMSKSPDDRFPSMDAVVVALQPFAGVIDDVEPPH